jgi:hypothetical protein
VGVIELVGGHAVFGDQRCERAVYGAIRQGERAVFAELGRAASDEVGEYLSFCLGVYVWDTRKLDDFCHG